MQCNTLNCTALHCTRLKYIEICCTELPCIALFKTSLPSTVLDLIALYCTAHHNNVLHCTSLQCTVPNCQVYLHYMTTSEGHYTHYRLYYHFRLLFAYHILYYCVTVYSTNITLGCLLPAHIRIDFQRIWNEKPIPLTCGNFNEIAWPLEGPLFKASAPWADAFYKSKCPSVRVSVCPSVHFWGTV